ncbi:MAG: hypothetical protein RBS56_04975 [Candidatus Gracilibacteria bacterium]|jgi:hypothetical protein|nr:hypothetical protein [Candidatus Gracilibacteria bacterium]
MILKRLKSGLSLKYMVVFGLAIFSLHLFVNGLTAYAVDIPGLEEQASLASVILGISGALNRLLWPILIMIGGLLDNSILFGSGMDARLREIWIPVRNLVNLVFVVGLVGIAIYNMTSLADDNASIKGLLPKMVIGIIAINFSFLGIKVFLDAINVATSAVFALPDQVSEGLAEIEITKDPNQSRLFCLAVAGKASSETTYWDNPAALEAYQRKVAKKQAMYEFGLKTEDQCTQNPACEDKAKRYFDNGLCNGFTLSSEGQKFFDTFGGQNVALAMAIELGQIMYYQDVDISVENVEKVLVSIIISLILYAIYAVTFIALFIVLLARLIVLWIIIAMSPVIILGSAIPAIGSKISSLSSAKDTFIQNAIAPLIISVSMTIGWIMLKAMKSIDSVGSENLSAVFNSTDGALPIVGLTTMQDVIVGIGVIAITWVAITSAMSKTIAKSITDTLYGGLKQAGNWIANIPLNTNLIPVKLPGEPTAKPTNINDILSMGRTRFNQMSQPSGDLNRRMGGTLKAEAKYWAQFDGPQQRLAYLYETQESRQTVFDLLKAKKGTAEFSAMEEEYKKYATNKDLLNNFATNGLEIEWNNLKTELATMKNNGKIQQLTTY